MATTKGTAMKKAGWEKICDCGFMLRDYNESEFVTLVQSHVKNTHGQNLDPKAVLATSKKLG